MEKCGVSVFAGLDHWTGLLDWTTGLMNNVILKCKFLDNAQSRKV